MSLFGAIIRTAVNVVAIPVAVAKDVITLGAKAADDGESYTAEAIEKLKDEADDD